MFFRLFAVVALAAIVSSCSYSHISGEGLYQYGRPFQMADRVSDETYEKLKLYWRGDFKGRHSTVYVKRFDVDGRLVMCGLRVRDVGLREALEIEWFAGGNFVIDGADIVSTRFLRAQSEKFVGDGEVVSCMNTGWPAHESLMTKQVYVDGVPARVTVGGPEP